VRVRPLDSGRSRVYVAPLGLWLTLDAGTFEAIELAGTTVSVTLSPGTSATPNARLRIEQPARVAGVGDLAPAGRFALERGAYVVRLGRESIVVVLRVAE
jgi:hypothetical protein